MDTRENSLITYFPKINALKFELLLFLDYVSDFSFCDIFLKH